MKEKVEIYDIQPLENVAYIPSEILWLIIAVIALLLIIFILIKNIKSKKTKFNNSFNKELKEVEETKNKEKQITLFSELINSLILINNSDELKKIKNELNNISYSKDKSNINSLIAKTKLIVSK